MNNIEIYIGDNIEYNSEELVLQQLIESLSKIKHTALILANVNVNVPPKGTKKEKTLQIDTIVIVDDMTLVIEAKGGKYPMSGKHNGDWRKLNKKIDNFYRQTLNAKLQFKDAIKDFLKKEIEYPKAALILVDGVHEKSSIPNSDQKIKIGDLTSLKDLSIFSGKPSLSVKDGRAFAKILNLKKVSFEEAISPILLEAKETIKDYLKSFEDAYKKEASSFVNFSVTINEKIFEATQLLYSINDKNNMLVYGPSGCGKSLLVRKICLEIIKQHEHILPIIIGAQYFEGGKFKNLLNQAVSTFTTKTIEYLLRACNKTNFLILIILDGLNECPANLQSRLLQYLKSFTKRYNSFFIISTNDNTKMVEDIINCISKVNVAYPDLELKKKISGVKDEDFYYLEPLFKSSKTCLEASIIGCVAQVISPRASMFVLFDTYFRKLFGEKDHLQIIKLLINVAKHLLNKISFHLSVIDFNLLLIKLDFPCHLYDKLFNHLLKRQHDKIIFAHEAFLNFFKAEYIYFIVEDNKDLILKNLSKPENVDFKELILGAIEDSTISSEIMKNICDYELMVSCVQGRCGKHQQSWVLDACTSIISKITQQARDICFNIDFKEPFNPELAMFTNLTNQDWVLIKVVSLLLTNTGLYLDEIYEIAGIMDQSLSRNLDNLKQQLQAKAALSLKNELYDCCFSQYYISNPIALPKIFIMRHIPRNGDNKIIIKWLNQKLKESNITAGKLYMILWLSYFINPTNSDLPEVLPSLIKTQWTDAPELLKIRLCRTAGWCAYFIGSISTVLPEKLPSLLRTQWTNTGDLLKMQQCQIATWYVKGSDQRKTNIITSLQEVEISSICVYYEKIEALKKLGAIRSSMDDIKSEINIVLESKFNEGSVSNMAKYIYFRRFDDLCNIDYCEEWNNLPSIDKKRFLAVAKKAKTTNYALLPFLIIDLARYDELDTKYLEPLARQLPERQGVAINREELTCFILSYMMLGYLKYDLTTVVDSIYSNNYLDNAFYACGELYYWLSRNDLSPEEKNLLCQRAWDILNNNKLIVGISIGIINLNESSIEILKSYLTNLQGFAHNSHSFSQYYSKEIANISRNTIINYDVIIEEEIRNAIGISLLYPHKENLIIYAIQHLSTYGNMDDIILFSRLIKDSSNSVVIKESYNAIKKIELKFIGAII